MNFLQCNRSEKNTLIPIAILAHLQNNSAPNNLIKEVETAIKGTNCTFTAFVVEAVRVALENIKEETDEK